MTDGCTVDGCERPLKGRRLCSPHYQRLARWGRLELLREPADCRPIVDGEIARVPLTQGKVAIIDAGDADLVSQHIWAAARAKRDRYYAQASLAGNGVIAMHRLLIEPPDDMLVDHIDGDGLNNRRANLRPCTNSQNLQNLSSLRSNNQSGWMGVGYRADRGRWRAYVKSGGKFRHLGYFDTALDAALGRDAWIRENDPSEFWTYNVPLLPGERAVNRQRESA
jgi:hypothetical protein